MNNTSLVLNILVGIGISLLCGFLAGILTTEGILSWYPSLQKPFFTPPNWLFGPVWTILYLFIGIVGGMLWHESTKQTELAQTAFRFWCLQLLLNVLWSPVFFTWQQPVWALLIILTLWLVITICMVLLSKIQKIGFFLFIPYWLWVSFATILNFSICYLNGYLG